MKNKTSINTIRITIAYLALAIIMLCSSTKTIANNSNQENVASESAGDIIILFDQSQSMNYLYPTPVVEKIIEKLVEKFSPQYPITITGFSETVIEHFKIEVNNRQQITLIKDKFLQVNTRQKITNFEPALNYLVNYPNKINRIILVTDGKSDIWDEKLRHLSLSIRSDDRYRDLNLQFFKLKKSGYTHLQRFEKLHTLYEKRNLQLISSSIDELNKKEVGPLFIIQLDKPSSFLATWSKQAKANIIAITELPENLMLLEQKLDQAINQISLQQQSLTPIIVNDINKPMLKHKGTQSPPEEHLNNLLNKSVTKNKVDKKTNFKNIKANVKNNIVKTTEAQREISENEIEEIKTELTTDSLDMIESSTINDSISNNMLVNNQATQSAPQPLPQNTLKKNNANQSTTQSTIKENRKEALQQLSHTESKKNYNYYIIILCILIFIYWLLTKKNKTLNLSHHSEETNNKQPLLIKDKQVKAFNSRMQLRVELNPGQMDIHWLTDSGVQKSASVVNISLHALLFRLSSEDTESPELESELKKIKTIKINKTNEIYKLNKIKIEARNDGTYVMFLSEFEDHINTSMHWIEMLTRIDEDTIK